jgi:hypothetical protein
MAQLKNPIKEAERYFDNAKQILSEKAEKEGNYYQDQKYVKMAGNTAWNGVLVALDGVLGVRKQKKNGSRPDVDDYRDALYKKDRKMNSVFLSAYETLHKSLGYDGNPSYKVVKSGLDDGKLILDWAAKHYKI